MSESNDSNEAKDLWVILLDSSGSMASPFSGNHQFAGHVETGDYATKIEAAKDRLTRELRGFPASHVCIIGFSDYPECLYLGAAEDTTTIQSKIQGIEANGSTDIGAALGFGLQKVLETPHDFASILLI